MHIANSHRQHQQRDDGNGSKEISVRPHCFAASTANMIMAMMTAQNTSGAMVSILPNNR
jgi:hypothetical protein